MEKVEKLTKLVMNELEEMVKNGGEGSGDFGHAGRLGKVGGSQPVEERKINKGSEIQRDKNKKSDEEKRQTEKEFKDRLAHEQIKQKVDKMKDEELVKEFLSAREKMEKEPVGKAGELSESEEMYGVIAQKLKEKTGRGFSQSSTKEEIIKELEKSNPMRDELIKQVEEKEKYKLKGNPKITQKRFDNLFDDGSYLENHQFRKTIVLDNIHQVEFDKKRGFITFYELGDVSKSKYYNAPRGTMGMIQKFRTDDYNKLVDYLFKNNQEWRFNRNKANNSLYKHEYIEY